MHGGVPLTFPAVTCRTFPLRTVGIYGNVPLHQIHTFKKLMVVERTISDLRAKSAYFYTCNTVVLYTRLIWAGLPMLLQAH